MSQPVPVAVIGAGRMAHAVYLRILPDLGDDFTLVAVVEPEPLRARVIQARFPGLLVTRELEPAVRAGARAAVCATPWATHAEVVNECLELGLPVLCEKPVSLVPAEVDWLRDRERAIGLPVIVGYMKRHDPSVTAFVELACKAQDELRMITVRIIDPNAPHQVSHLVPASVLAEPSPISGEADRKLDRLLGPGGDPAVRTAYAHGLGGSLIHHVNLVNAMLDGSGIGLFGAVSQASQWHQGRSVACNWQPSGGLAVHVSYVCVPRHQRYRERVELVTERCWATLQFPSPYARDAAATMDVERWDDSATASRPFRLEPSPGETGFVLQMRRWASSLREEDVSALPGLTEARRDVAVVYEAVIDMSRRSMLGS
jgi:hypothetical protein